MNLCKWTLCAVVTVALTAGWTLAADKPADPKADAPKVDKADKPAKAEKPKSALSGTYAIMVAELKLDDAQKAKLEEKVKANSAAIDAWEKDKGPKLKELQDASKAARDKGDKDAETKASAAAKELQGELGKLRDAQAAEVAALLTDAQKAQWDNYQFYAKYVGKYGKAKLTDEQKAKVRALTDAANAELKKAAAIEKKLADDVAALLTPEQKAELDKKPQPKKDAKTDSAKPADKPADKPAEKPAK